MLESDSFASLPLLVEQLAKQTHGFGSDDNIFTDGALSGSYISRCDILGRIFSPS